MEFSLNSTKTVETVKVKIANHEIYFHSKYDPLKEARNWVEKYFPSYETDHIYLFGIGAGYHVLKLNEKYPEMKISVIELNDEYLKWFSSSKLLPLLGNRKNIEIISGSALLKENKMKNLFINTTSNVFVFEQSLNIIPKQFDSLLPALKDLLIMQKTICEQRTLLAENFHKNLSLNDSGLKEWKNYYQNKKMILVSAGPSLTKQLPTLKRLNDDERFVIGCVGTALRPLYHYGIIPKFVMISDPKIAITEQFEGVDVSDIHLFYLSTANHEAVQCGRNRTIVYQIGYPEAERLASCHDDLLIKTGGSVATCLLDTMVNLGAKSIALVGQDLAYTNGYSHANNTHDQRIIYDNSYIEYVDDFYRTEKVATARNLSVYRKWFEEYSKYNHSIEFYNCTEGGAYIEGWKHRALKDYIKIE